jgi:hypothetical protein
VDGRPRSRNFNRGEEGPSGAFLVFGSFYRKACNMSQLVALEIRLTPPRAGTRSSPSFSIGTTSCWITGILLLGTAGNLINPANPRAGGQSVVGRHVYLGQRFLLPAMSKPCLDWFLRSVEIRGSMKCSAARDPVSASVSVSHDTARTAVTAASFLTMGATRVPRSSMACMTLACGSVPGVS